MEGGKNAQVVRSNVHRGQTVGHPFLNITLGTCTLGLVLNCVSIFCHLPILMDMIRKSNVKFTVANIVGIASRTPTARLSSVLFMRAHGRNLSQVSGKAAFQLSICGVFVDGHDKSYN